MLLAVQTGLRAPELTALACRDVRLSGGAYVACHGKGRKDRLTPLSPGVTFLVARGPGRGGVEGEPCLLAFLEALCYADISDPGIPAASTGPAGIGITTVSE